MSTPVPELFTHSLCHIDKPFFDCHICLQFLYCNFFSLRVALNKYILYLNKGTHNKSIPRKYKCSVLFPHSLI